MALSLGDALNTGAAVASAFAAVAAWRAARRSNTTAEVVAKIERERWHADLTPDFNITIESVEGDRATMNVHLAGPLALRHLNEVAISIGNDDAERTAHLAGSVSQEELDAQVWGPYRFTYGADGADVNGRAVRPVPLHVGRGRPFAIEKTRAPRWQRGDDANERWRQQYDQTPIRLVLTCRSEGHEPWTVPYEVETPSRPRVRRM